MPRTGTLSGLLLGVLVMVIALIAAAPAAQAEVVPSPWTWTDYGPALRDVSCSSPDHCVAVGQRGMVLRTTAAGDDHLAWSRIPMEYPEELDGVTCTGSFCLAVSNTREESAIYVSKVFRSTDGGATWSAGVELPAAGPTKTRSALGLACDGAAGVACYAVGPSGGVWRSLDQGESWEALGLPKTPGTYDRIACPAAEVCVAAGGDVVGTSAVIEGTKVTDVPVPAKFGKGLLALACDSATQCVATDGLGHYSLLTIASRSWSPPKLFPKAAPVAALSCPRENTCVGLAEGIAMRTTAVASATGEWHRRPIGSLNLGALDCVGDDCAAVGKAASWFNGTEVGFDWDRANEVAKFDAIQCPAAFAGTCVAGGEKDIGVSRSGGKLWSLPLSGYSGLNVKSLNCTEKSECLFLGKTLTLFTKDLISFAERHPTTTDPKGTDAQTCVTKDICVGINEGVVYTTLDGAVTGWNENAFPDKATSVACVHGREPVECVATTREFLIFGTMTHADGQIRWHWRYTDADPPEALEAVGCSPGGQCTAVGGGGEVLTSQGTDLLHWTEPIPPDLTEPVDTRPLLKSVVCPADGECLAGGVHGPDAIILSTTDNWANHSEEKIEGIEGAAPTITSFGCESVDRCVAVGSTSLVGVRKPAAGN